MRSFSNQSLLVSLHDAFYLGPSPFALCLKFEQLFHRPHCILRILDTVPNCPAVFEDFIIISTFECFVSEEVDGRVINTTERLLCFQVLQAVSLIPASGEYIEGNLSADRVATMVYISLCQ